MIKKEYKTFERTLFASRFEIEGKLKVVNNKIEDIDKNIQEIKTKIEPIEKIKKK